MPSFKSAHDSSSITKTWVDSIYDSSDFPGVESESTHDSNGFPRYWFKLTHDLRCFSIFRFKSTHDSSEKHLILSQLMIRLWVIPLSAWDTCFTGQWEVEFDGDTHFYICPRADQIQVKMVKFWSSRFLFKTFVTCSVLSQDSKNVIYFDVRQKC